MILKIKNSTLILDLPRFIRSGRSANDLAKVFEPTAQTVSAWVCQTDRDEGRQTDGLTSREQAELQRLR